MNSVLFCGPKACCLALPSNRTVPFTPMRSVMPRAESYTKASYAMSPNNFPCESPLRLEYAFVSDPRRGFRRHFIIQNRLGRVQFYPSVIASMQRVYRIQHFLLFTWGIISIPSIFLISMSASGESPARSLFLCSTLLFHISSCSSSGLEQETRPNSRHTST